MEMDSGKHVRFAWFNALFIMGRNTRGRDTVPVDSDGRIVPADTAHAVFVIRFCRQCDGIDEIAQRQHPAGESFRNPEPVIVVAGQYRGDPSGKSG